MKLRARRIVESLTCLFILGSPLSAQEFVLGWEQSGGQYSSGVALGDVDGDGDLDLYVSDLDGPDHLYWNDGSGGFEESGLALDDSLGAMPNLADLDGDGDLDLALARHLVASSVWLNDGTGVLTDAGTVGDALSRKDGFVFDADGDGDLDFLLPSETQAENCRLYRNDGTAQFTDSGQVFGALWSRAGAPGDVDGDGDPDLVFANGTTWWNDGTGGFTDSGLDVGGLANALALGDLDGDGHLDAVFGMGNPFGPSTDIVALNDGTGELIDTDQDLSTKYTLAVELWDGNGDGDLDLLVGANATQDTEVWINDGAGTFSPWAGQILGNNGVNDIARGDLDGDGDDDLVFASAYAFDQVWLREGSRFELSNQAIGSAIVTAAVAGRVDGDHHPDLLLGTLAGVVATFSNRGRGELVPVSPSPVSGAFNGAVSLLLEDFDGDGDADLFAGTRYFGGSADSLDRVLWNDGEGNFTDSGQRLGVFRSTWSARAGDLDGDGDIDIVAGTDGDIDIYRNDGTGVFAVEPTPLGSAVPGLHDLDGDGDLDAYVRDPAGLGDAIWLNDGTGQFTDSGQLLGDSLTFAVDFGDLDGDGDIDIVSGRQGFDTVWWNDGSGAFTDSGQAIGTGASTLGVHLLDVDADGDLDLWGSQSQAPAYVWVNDGTGIFTDSGFTHGDLEVANSVVADFDDNGYPDVAVLGVDGTHRVWWDARDTVIFEDGFEGGTTDAWDVIEP